MCAGGMKADEIKTVRRLPLRLINLSRLHTDAQAPGNQPPRLGRSDDLGPAEA